jgi:hypothetical protein
MALGAEIELRAERLNQRLHYQQLVNVSNVVDFNFTPTIRTGRIGIWKTHRETEAEGLLERVFYRY